MALGLGEVLVEEQEGEEGLVYKMPLSVKGKRMFNILLKAYGKRKGRDIFYALENKHPDWVAKWRK